MPRVFIIHRHQDTKWVAGRLYDRFQGEDGQGHLRLTDPRDWIRFEVGVALRNHKAVVPVLVDDTPMPSAQDLPKGLKRLVKRRSFTIRHDRFEDDVQELIHVIKRYIEREERNRRAIQEAEHTSKDLYAGKVELPTVVIPKISPTKAAELTKLLHAYYS
jgi:hypothetical protein